VGIDSPRREPSQAAAIGSNSEDGREFPLLVYPMEDKSVAVRCPLRCPILVTRESAVTGDVANARPVRVHDHEVDLREIFPEAPRKGYARAVWRPRRVIVETATTLATGGEMHPPRAIRMDAEDTRPVGTKLSRVKVLAGADKDDPTAVCRPVRSEMKNPGSRMSDPPLVRAVWPDEHDGSLGLLFVEIDSVHDPSVLSRDSGSSGARGK
jgi:hypothetical protein